MPWSTAAILGLVASILAATWSFPFGAQWSRQAVPFGFVAPSSAHFSATPTSPASFPPIPTVTSVASLRSALNCGGFVPPSGSSVWGSVMCFVWALPQLTSTNVVTFSACATSDG
jgi:hypothetical protein